MENTTTCQQKSILKDCQIQSISAMAELLGIITIAWQLRNRIRRFLKRRYVYLINLLMLSSNGEAGRAGAVQHDAEDLATGKLVRIKSREEIRHQLNCWDQLKGCAFMEEMWEYCGTTQRIFKRVNRFLDERDYQVKKCNGLYILDGVVCKGTRDFGPCDRSCFLFWREEWFDRSG